MGIQIIKPPRKDTSICNKNCHRYYKNKLLAVGNEGDYVYQSLLTFDLSLLPSYIQILHSTLNIYLVFNDYPYTQKTIGIFQILSDWHQKTVHWRNKPLTTSQPLASQKISSKEDIFLNFDITTLMQDWYTNRAANFGIMVKSLEENIDSLTYFSSRECKNSTYWPYIEVTYQYPTNGPYYQLLDISVDVTTENSFTSTAPLYVLPFNYSYLVVNDGDQPALAYLQVSSDSTSWRRETTICQIQPKQTMFFVADTLTKYAQLCYQSALPEQPTNLTIHIQGRT